MEKSILFIESPKLADILQSVFEYDNFGVNVQDTFPDQATIDSTHGFVFHDISTKDKNKVLAIHKQGKSVIVLRRTISSPELTSMYEAFEAEGIGVYDKNILFNIKELRAKILGLISQVRE